MRALPLLFILILGCVSIATFATSQNMSSIGDRPTDLIAADLGVDEQVFIDCFSGVSPDSAHAPSGATQRANKAVLLPCLQAAEPSITNRMLDTVMDRYRPEGPMHG